MKNNPLLTLLVVGLLICASACKREVSLTPMRNTLTRQVSTRCGLYRDAVEIDPRTTKERGQATMVVAYNGVERDTTTWSCLSREARRLGYAMGYSLVLTATTVKATGGS
ncbi:MAG: hypothetical protein EOP14_01775 [Pseudomonas sp.]|nr:MAG: hypothetical protein EOP14_01775 [Pseudomonas sp.]